MNHVSTERTEARLVRRVTGRACSRADGDDRLGLGAREAVRESLQVVARGGGRARDLLHARSRASQHLCAGGCDGMTTDGGKK